MFKPIEGALIETDEPDPPAKDPLADISPADIEAIAAPPKPKEPSEKQLIARDLRALAARVGQLVTEEARSDFIPNEKCIRLGKALKCIGRAAAFVVSCDSGSSIRSE